MAKERLALFGIGAMGYGVGMRLLAAGYPLRIAVHRSRSNAERLLEQGALEMLSPQSAVEQSDAVLLCLPTSADTLDFVERTSDALESRHLIIDLGTSSVADAKNVAAKLQSRGVCFAEAPLAGGQAQAAAGELGAFVGATDAVFSKIKPILASFCTSIQHYGPVGCGGAAKLVSNYLVLSMALSIVETFRAAQALGIDWRKFHDTIRRGAGNSMALERMVGTLLEEGSDQGYAFSIKHARKDLEYIAQLSEMYGIEPILSKAALALFTEADEKGFGERLVSELLRDDILRVLERFGQRI